MSDYISLLDFIINESIYCISPISFKDNIMKQCSQETGQYVYHIFNHLSSHIDNMLLFLSNPYNPFIALRENSRSNFYSDDLFSNEIKSLSADSNIQCVIHNRGITIYDDLINNIDYCNSEFILIVQLYNDIKVRKATQSVIKHLNLKKMFAKDFITRWPNSPIDKKSNKYGEHETFGNGLYIAVLKK